jgi:hypothetical protein
VTGRTSGGCLPGGRALTACAIIRPGLHQQRHRDGASAIHSAEETVGLLIVSCLLNEACRVRSLIETVTVSPLTATCALSRSPGWTVMLTGTWAAGTSSYQAE